jgi:hypothetical protein
LESAMIFVFRNWQLYMQQEVCFFLQLTSNILFLFLSICLLIMEYLLQVA